jgi:hypothetical protein
LRNMASIPSRNPLVSPSSSVMIRLGHSSISSSASVNGSVNSLTSLTSLLRAIFGYHYSPTDMDTNQEY